MGYREYLRGTPDGRRLLRLVGLMLILRAALLVFNSHGLELNPDEYGNYHLAQSWVQGHGYTRFDAVTQTHKPLAFYATFPIWVYAVFIKLGITIAAWVLLVHLTGLALYALGIFYFDRLLEVFGLTGRLRFWGTVLYAAYPSTLFYIGSVFWYENLTMPLLVIVLYHLLLLTTDRKIPPTATWLLPVLITVSILFRGQLLFIYLVIFLIFGALNFRQLSSREGKQALRLTLLTALLVALAHVPILVKNHRIFGAWMLSTQPGFELLQGHNPYADGKWTMAWTDPGEPLFEYVRARAPRFQYLDQYSESKLRAALAKAWIKENPGAELRLLGRKLVLYFTPDNSPFYEGNFLPGFNRPNPVNLVAHLGFLLFLGAALLNRRRFPFGQKELLLLSPVLATILLSLIFFFGHRWRFYAEPPMLLFTLLLLNGWLQKKKPATREPVLPAATN